MDYKDEVWRPVVGYEGYYEVSSYGRVKRCAKDIQYYMRGKLITRKGREKILSPGIKDTGYYNVSLFVDNIGKTHKVHRLVAEAFIPNPDNKPFIDHIDANRLNNRVENLRWVTPTENNANPIFRERQSRCKDKYKKDIIQYDKFGNIIKIWKGLRTVARELGIHHVLIRDCCKGKIKMAGGYIWRFG